jgi:hypothetical protein
MTPGADLVVHPGTGEVLERLDDQPAEVLAEALVAVRARQEEAKRWSDALEAELRRRLQLRQTKLAVFGEWEVEAAAGRESVWDAEQLEGAMRELVDEGVVKAGDVADVITREPVVSRSKAKALQARLTGDARERVAAACTWRDKPGKLTVARSVELPAPEQAAELAPGAPAPALGPPAPAAPHDGRPADAASDPVSTPAPLSALTPEELFS